MRIVLRYDINPQYNGLACDRCREQDLDYAGIFDNDLVLCIRCCTTWQGCEGMQDESRDILT